MIYGSDVCEYVNTMIRHPYRNEKVRLLLHNKKCAIGVFFLSYCKRERRKKYADK